jgi:hypothetical protein
MKRSVRFRLLLALVSAPVVGGVLYAVCGMLGLPENEWLTIAVIGGIGVGAFLFFLAGA